MRDDVNISPDAIVARVVSKSEDGCTVYFEQKNGGAGNMTSNDGEPLAYKTNDVILLWPGQNRVDVAPSEIWPDAARLQKEESVAVVRLRADDVTVVDDGGRWRKLRTTPLDYKEGNTVLVSTAGEISRILSTKSIRLFDVDRSNEVDISRFKVDTTKVTETFADFGGMERVVEQAKRLIELPFTRREQLDKIGARPIKGVLFSGPPGTGKTMLARIIARQANAAFYQVNGPEILSKWYGESEAILRGIFDDAAQQEQAIIFFDELDSVASRRSDRTHEVSQKVVAQLLTRMDGFTPNKKVVVVAATNRPEALDPALRRPGRFDWEVEFSLPDQSGRRAILECSGRTLNKHGTIPYDDIAARTDGWSSAELAAVWSEAAFYAAEDGRDAILEEDYQEGFVRVQLQRGQKRGLHV